MNLNFSAGFDELVVGDEFLLNFMALLQFFLCVKNDGLSELFCDEQTSPDSLYFEDFIHE